MAEQDDGMTEINGLLNAIQVLHAQARSLANAFQINLHITLVADNEGNTTEVVYDAKPAPNRPWF